MKAGTPCKKSAKFKNLKKCPVLALRTGGIMARGKVAKRKTGPRTCFPLKSSELPGRDVSKI